MGGTVKNVGTWLKGFTKEVDDYANPEKNSTKIGGGQVGFAAIFQFFYKPFRKNGSAARGNSLLPNKLKAFGLFTMGLLCLGITLMILWAMFFPNHENIVFQCVMKYMVVFGSWMLLLFVIFVGIYVVIKK